MILWYQPLPIYSKQAQAPDNVNTMEHESRLTKSLLSPYQQPMFQKILQSTFLMKDEVFPEL